MQADDVEAAVAAAIAEVGGRPVVAAHQTLTGDLGLKSLDIAELVAVLEATLGVDPFASLAAIADVRTVGDLVAAYRRALP